ncbi:hypothetical protein BH11ACT8_BH11ACT8_11380 [soil metagenome]
MSDYASLMENARLLGLEAARAELRYHGWERTSTGWLTPPGSSSYLETEKDRALIPDPAHGPTGSIDISPGYGVMVNVWSEWFEPWVIRAQDTFRPWQQGELPDPTFFGNLAEQVFETAHRLNLTGEQTSGHRVPTNVELKWVGNTESALEDMSGDTIKAFREQWLSGLQLVLPSLCGAAATASEVVATEAVIFHEAQLSVAKILDGAMQAMEKAGISEASASLKDALTVAGAGTAVFGAISKVGLGPVLGAISGVVSFVEVGKSLTFKGQTAADVFGDVDDSLQTLSTDIATEEDAAAERMQALDADFSTYSGSYRLEEPRLLHDNDEAGYAGTGHEVLQIDGQRLIDIADDYLPKIAAEFSLAYQGVSDAYSHYEGWSRAGTIGRAPSGARPEWAATTFELASIIHQVPNTLAEVSHHLHIAARYHGDNDEAVAVEMQGHTHDLDAAAAPYGMSRPGTASQPY